MYKASTARATPCALGGAGVKVLIAEDLDTMRKRFGELLAEVGNVELNFVLQDSELVMRIAADWRPDVVILDVRMRGMMTLGIVNALKKGWPEIAVAVSAFFFQPYFREAFLNLGADLFFGKSAALDELLEFLRRRQAPALHRLAG